MFANNDKKDKEDQDTAVKIPHDEGPPPVVGVTLDEPETSGDDLIEIKKQALSKLSPLVDNLEQPPQEHFKTIMMLIQATDDSSLIARAYDAANEINEEKDRAQALLDVVNEINYFTQNKKSK